VNGQTSHVPVRESHPNSRGLTPSAPNPRKLTFGSLFAGIGGLDLGLERAGMECAFQVEIADYPTTILERHWPDVPRFRDICDVRGDQLPRVDVLTGGFPCQDISTAGKRAGITGARSGLWKEYLRLIQELKPQYVIAENVAALLHRGAGFGVVLEDLATSGFNVEWQVLPAAAFGAPHLRERVFIIAYSHGVNEHVPPRVFESGGNLGNHFQFSSASHWNGVGIDRTSKTATLRTVCQSLATEPLVSRLDDGVSEKVGALAGYGNAVVPAVAEFVGRSVIDFDHRRGIEARI
jgi:DNA (cytosine-5)-methyltransferase 1